MTEKEALKRAYLKGYELGKGVENVQDISIKTATVHFERWYSVNFEDTENDQR